MTRKKTRCSVCNMIPIPPYLWDGKTYCWGHFPRQTPDGHAPDEIGGTDEPSEGQALGSKKAEEGES